MFLQRRLKKLIPNEALLNAYYELFHSHLNYGIMLWGNCTSTKNVFLLQKKAVRILMGCNPIGAL
ncbi:hypothetical protein C0J52_02747 [Blattella germanica]|nr:hypothetical protein C0J52_02747 [Blattella germanica]